MEHLYWDIDRNMPDVKQNVMLPQGPTETCQSRKNYPPGNPAAFVRPIGVLQKRRHHPSAMGDRIPDRDDRLRAIRRKAVTSKGSPQ
jgi:hypothetical protein